MATSTFSPVTKTIVSGDSAGNIEVYKADKGVKFRIHYLHVTSDTAMKVYFFTSAQRQSRYFPNYLAANSTFNVKVDGLFGSANPGETVSINTSTTGNVEVFLIVEEIPC